MIARRWDRLIYGQCSVLIAHTGRNEQCLSSVLKRKLLYASAFVDVRRFATADAMPPGDHDDEPIVFGFVGRIAREKHLSDILEHADTIKRLGCRLMIVGDGPERARLARRSLARFAARSVRFAFSRSCVSRDRRGKMAANAAGVETSSKTSAKTED